MRVADQCPVPCFLCFQQVRERVGCSDALLLVAGCKSTQHLLYCLWEAGQASQGQILGGSSAAGCAAAETAAILTSSSNITGRLSYCCPPMYRDP